MIEEEEFINSPIEVIRSVAPKTLIYCPGGTRRAAVINNIKVPSDEYVQWSRQQMVEYIHRLFDHGVEHVFTGSIFPTAWREITPEYREQMLKWTAWNMAGDDAIADYQRYGWRVRATGTEYFPEEYGLQKAAERLVDETSSQAKHTLWLQSFPSEESAYDMAFKAIQQGNAQTRAEAIRNLYGMDVPPATMLISFGKLLITPAILPPLLIGNIQAYWTQKPGYSLTTEDIRRIFYDAAYLRQTWVKDKTGRESNLSVDKIIGLGFRRGSHWVPY